jgi:hypothetical protein
MGGTLEGATWSRGVCDPRNDNEPSLGIKRVEPRSLWISIVGQLFRVKVARGLDQLLEPGYVSQWRHC